MDQSPSNKTYPSVCRRSRSYTSFNILNNTFKEIEDITDVHQMTNQQLKRLIQKIEVDKDGNVDIYLRLLGDLGLDESVLIDENETVQKCNNQT